MTVERNVARVALAALVALAGLVLGSTGVAMAVAPNLAILAPAAASSTHEQKPQFSGTTDDVLDPVTLKVYAGTDTTAPAVPVQTLVDPVPLEVALAEATWSATPPESLEPGQYTAVAEQTNAEPETGQSPPVTFTIDTTPPTVSVSAPAAGAELGESQPSISGLAGQAAGDDASITVKLYASSTVSGSPIQTHEVTPSGADWTTGPVAALADGTYTVQAEQSDAAGNTGTSTAVTFTIDTALPAVTLTSPVTGSSTTSTFEALGGAAGTSAGDLPQITVKLFGGSQVTSGAPLQEVTVPAVNGVWSAAFGGLGLGTYTVQAQQGNKLDRTGFSKPVTFTVKAPVVPPSEPKPTTTTTTTTPAPTPPAASFQWFPAAPRVGEAVTLFSTSTDPTGPIVGFAWSVAGSGVFTAGSSTFTTSFSTPGSHMVQLLVTSASGAANSVAETIPVTVPEAILMQPFPVVRIAGSETATGARVGLLTVQAPVGATVRVACYGTGCPVRAQSVLAAPGKGKSNIKAGVVTVVLQRFERTLRAGVVLEIRVSKPGQIGKYTRFTVRHGRLPTRADMCLSPAGIDPIACPS